MKWIYRIGVLQDTRIITFTIDDETINDKKSFMYSKEGKKYLQFCKEVLPNNKPEELSFNTWKEKMIKYGYGQLYNPLPCCGNCCQHD